MEAIAEQREFKAQAGPQEQFLSSPADIVVYGGAAFGGKLLALDTPIPTPDGWTTMGKIKSGDRLFSEDGRICMVLAAHPIDPSPESFRMTFDDGETIDAGADHLWKTMTMAEIQSSKRNTPESRAARRASRPKRGKGARPDLTARNQEPKTFLSLPPTGAIRTTAEIYRTLRTSRGRANHAIELPQPLELPPADLPLDPYLFGAWLGDGTSVSSGFTTADMELIESFRAAGFYVKKWKDKYGWGVHGLSAILRKMGVLGKKHVPAQYLRGSMSQRLALLQGLMDTDGHACAGGGVEFTNTNRHLADAVAEIAHSLGQKANVTEGRAMLNGLDCGPKYRIKWTARIPVFRLPRKLSHQRFGGQKASRFRYIVDCRPIPSVPMRCITVDSPSRLYLAGRAMVPTHNTFGLLMEGARHTDNPAFSCTIFRRSIPQIMNQGAIWDESFELYPYLGGSPSVASHSWTWPSGAEVKMAHLQEKKTIYDYDGAQIPLIEFDQLEQFTEKQFFYMLSRNRSGCGVTPYIRASANPPQKKGHWLRALVDWWIGKDGFPIADRCGIVRYFVRVDNQIQWVDSGWRDAEGTAPKSFTFIAAKYTDNRIGIAKDPNYVSNLNAQDRNDRQRLKEGNWNVSDEAGMFDRSWFKIVDRAPAGMQKIRYWDRAATEVTEKNPDPDWTAGGLGGMDNGILYICDMEHFRESPASNEARIIQCAEVDGHDVEVIIEQEPGSSGKDVVDNYQRKVLKGFTVRADRPTGDKVTRAKPWSALAERGNVCLVRGPWIHNFLAEVETFPHGKKDQVDAVSGLYKFLCDAGPQLFFFGATDETANP